jgi:hypothetical protein
VAPGATGQQVVTCRKCWENAGKMLGNRWKIWKNDEKSGFLLATIKVSVCYLGFNTMNIG